MSPSNENSNYGFIGEFEHSVDGKNRVILPSSIRECLATDERLIVTTGTDSSLFLFPYILWEELLNKDEFQGFDEDTRQLKRAFSARAREITLDGQGRILLPEKLKNYAEIDSEVTVVGNFDRVELWSPGNWEEYQQSIDMDELAETVFES